MSAGLIVLQALASITSVAMCLSSAPTIYQIHRQRDTSDVPLLPLIGLLINCHMLMMYGAVTGDFFPLFATYLFGEALAIIYIVIYTRWTATRRYAVKSLVISLAFIFAASLFVVLAKARVINLSSAQLDTATGYLMAVGSVVLYVSPFETIARVLRTRSAASIPVAMCVAGAVSNALWVVDGLLVGDVFVLALGAICAALAAVQVVLYLVFRPTPSAQIAVDELVDISVHGKNAKPRPKLPSSPAGFVQIKSPLERL